ncbi:MAG: electron transfer flavoprotein subunit beta/FixA family protein [Dehalococcoidia bacterium]|nr:electron transfer flavoprotein subunit beta/FixA family protein [Dehalococcoidia bacterium]
MHIIVCVKQVPDPTIVKYDLETGALKNIHHIMDALDEIALSEAINIRQKHGGKVTAVSLGPAQSEAVLRTCLKMGADKAVHVCDPLLDDSDSYLTALALSRVIAREEYDLVLCGKESMDEADCFLGAGIAEWLSLPLVTCATRIDIYADTRTAIVHRRLKGGDREVVESPLPALFTVEGILAKPVYPCLRTILSGLRKDVARLDAATLGLDAHDIRPRVAVVGISQPKPRLKKTATIDSSLSPAERMKLITAGGVAQKKSNIIDKLPKPAAAEIIKFMLEHGLISHDRQAE